MSEDENPGSDHAAPLADCPFCPAGDDSTYVSWFDQGYYAVVCRICASQGPARDTGGDAADAWNARGAQAGLSEGASTGEIELGWPAPEVSERLACLSPSEIDEIAATLGSIYVHGACADTPRELMHRYLAAQGLLSRLRGKEPTT